MNTCIAVDYAAVFLLVCIGVVLLAISVGIVLHVIFYTRSK